MALAGGVDESPAAAADLLLRFQLRPLLALSFLIATVASAAPASLPPPASITVYRAASPEKPQPDETARLQDQRAREALREAAFVRDGKLEARARIALNLEARTIADTRELRLDDKAGLADGWYAYHGDYELQARGGGATAHSIPLAIDSQVDVSRWAELWVDYRPASGHLPACLPMVELAVRGEGAAHPHLLQGGRGVQFEDRLVLADAFARWQERGIGYLARRFMGGAQDGEWRYSQDGTRAVLQRRVEGPLAGVDRLRITLAPGLRLEQVNVRVSGSRDVLQFPLPQMHDATALLDLRDALRGGGRSDEAVDRMSVTEIVLFVPGDAGSIVRAAPLRHVALEGPRSAEHEEDPATFVRAVPSVDTVRVQQRRRISVDLRKEGEKGRSQLVGAVLQLSAPASNASCATRIESVRLANPSVDYVPAFAAALEKWTNHHGVVRDEGGTPRGEVLAPGIEALLDFRELSSAKSDGTMRASAQGAVLTSKDDFDKGIDGHGLSVNVGSDVVLDWPVQFSIRPSSRFYLKVSKATRDVPALALRLELADGRRVERRISPNVAERIDAGAAPPVRRVQLLLPGSQKYVDLLRAVAGLAAIVLIGWGLEGEWRARRRARSRDLDAGAVIPS